MLPHRSTARRSCRPIQNGRRGYSMLELVITISVLALIAGIALPRMADTLSAYRADAAADRLVSDLALAQKHARSTGSSETVTFDAVGNRYSFSTIADPVSASAVYSVDVTQYPYNAELSRVLVVNSAITFDGYGFPDASGKIAVSSGNATRYVKIDSSTGNATVGGD